MKRKLLITLLAILCVFACAFSFTACDSENESPVGNYKLYQFIVVGDKTYNLGDMLDGDLVHEDAFWLSVYENNTYVISALDEEGMREDGTGKWIEQKNGFLFYQMDGDRFEVKVKGGLLYFDYNDEPYSHSVLVFKKTNEGELL